MFGSHRRHISQAKHLVGHFNSHLQHCSYLFADECFFAGDKAHEGVLKTLITEEMLTELKGIDNYQVGNFLHLFMSSNNEWLVLLACWGGSKAIFRAQRGQSHYTGFLLISRQLTSRWRAAEIAVSCKEPRPIKLNVRDVRRTAALDEQRQHSRRG